MPQPAGTRPRPPQGCGRGAIHQSRRRGRELPAADLYRVGEGVGGGFAVAEAVKSRTRIVDDVAVGIPGDGYAAGTDHAPPAGRPEAVETLANAAAVVGQEIGGGEDEEPVLVEQIVGVVDS